LCLGSRGSSMVGNKMELLYFQNQDDGTN